MDINCIVHSHPSWGRDLGIAAHRNFYRVDVFKLFLSTFLVCKIIFEVCEINLKTN